MSRKVKNIIMITIIIIVCIASGFTINIAKESVEGTNQGNPTQMSNSSESSSTEPPAQPNNSTGSQQNQMEMQHQK